MPHPSPRGLPLMLILTLGLLPTVAALEYAIDCPPHGIHCALALDLSADILSHLDITQDPASVEAGANATIHVIVEALGAGVGGDVSGDVFVNITPTSGVVIAEPNVQVANVTVGAPPVELDFPIAFDSGLTAGQVMFVPLRATQGSDQATTYVPFTIVEKVSVLGTIGEVALQPLIVAPLSALLGGALVFWKLRKPEDPLG